MKKHHLFVLATMSILLSACGGGGGDNNTSNKPKPETPTVNTDLFSIQSKQWSIRPASNTSYCYDIDTQSEISCEKTDWDLKFAMGSRSTPALFTNSGVSGSGNGGALYSPFHAEWAKLSLEKNATQNGTIPSSAWLTDSYSNAFMDTKNGFNSFFEYDLFGDHRMSPNFKTFLVTTDPSSKNVIGSNDQPVFAVQIVGYYQGTTAGHIQLRYINTAFPNDIRELNVDATKNWNYVNLSNASSNNKVNGNWHLAFNRYNVQVNATAGSSVANQAANFYLEDGSVNLNGFKDSNALENTKKDLKAAATLSTVNRWGSNSISSVLNPNAQGTYPNKLSYGWYNYYPTITTAQADGLKAAHMLAANPNAASMIRSNTGNSYARVHLKEIQYEDPNNASSQTTWSFEFDIQPTS